MTYLQALILGIVQGLTEFIPVSSSGHLVLVPWVFGWDFLSPAAEKTFDVALHLGTLVAVVVALRADVKDLLLSAWSIVRERRVDTFEQRLVVYLLIGSVPAAIVGFVFEDVITEVLSDAWVIAITLAAFGVVMYLVDRFSSTNRELESLTFKDALFVGAAQAIALIPGTSRSGITITAGILRDLTRVTAVRFSFLLSLPITAGVVAYKMYELVTEPLPAGIGIGQLVVGVAASALTGWLAIEWLLSFLRRRTLLVFVIWRFAAALLVVILIVTGVRSPTG
ncbi:MAG: undecaprenyl-diphosphate phosphatase [Acidimicrobiia bacterium]|nr:undecaprenyl-diphosphate phosphatase [Acidimicrobiia bacterium]